MILLINLNCIKVFTLCSYVHSAWHRDSALISNEIKDPVKALETYRNKDVVKKAFGNLKERLNMRRTLVSSETSLEGKLFIQFIALVYLSYIKKQMQDENLYKNYTMQELLDVLDVIESFKYPGCDRRIGKRLRNKKDYSGPWS